MSTNYLIKNGQLKADKSGGRWRVAKADLPLTETRRAELADGVNAARAAFEKGVAPASKAADAGTHSKPPDSKDQEKKPYSVLDLHVFRHAEQLLRVLRAQHDAGPLPAAHLLAAMQQLTRGCHSFHPVEKATCFAAARTAAADAVTDLLATAGDANPALVTLAQRIEGELINRIGRLISASEKRNVRGRFDRFGSRSGRGREGDA